MLTLVFAATAIAPVALAGSASAHGWVTDPPSRQDSCAAGALSFDCGKLKYEPQSVEAPKGSMECSGGNVDYAILNDDTLPWPVKTIGTDVDINWNITARHATASWEYFLDGKLIQTVESNGAKPEALVTHRLTNLPEGEHTILARWNVADTINAFYNCLDVNVTKTGTVEPTTEPTVAPTVEPTVEPTTEPTVAPTVAPTVEPTVEPTTEPTVEPTVEPTTEPTVAPTVAPTTEPTVPPAGEVCDAAAWNVLQTYVGGNEVNYNGDVWKAKWWTVGNAPNLVDASGVWQYVGPCADATAPTASPSVAPTVSATPGDPAACGLAPWVAGNIYSGGDQISSNGHNWEAKWWTQGDEPGATDKYGVWKDLGVC